MDILKNMEKIFLALSFLLTTCLFNRYLNRGCLVYMVSLRFSGSST